MYNVQYVYSMIVCTRCRLDKGPGAVSVRVYLHKLGICTVVCNLHSVRAKTCGNIRNEPG